MKNKQPLFYVPKQVTHHLVREVKDFTDTGERKEENGSV